MPPHFPLLRTIYRERQLDAPCVHSGTRFSAISVYQFAEALEPRSERRLLFCRQVEYNVSTSDSIVYWHTFFNCRKTVMWLSFPRCCFIIPIRSNFARWLWRIVVVYSGITTYEFNFHLYLFENSKIN